MRRKSETNAVSASSCFIGKSSMIGAVVMYVESRRHGLRVPSLLAKAKIFAGGFVLRFLADHRRWRRERWSWRGIASWDMTMERIDRGVR